MFASASKVRHVSQAQSEVLLQGPLGSYGLYTFGGFFNTTTSPSLNTLAKNNAMEPTLYIVWHNRLGHPQSKALKVTLTICNIHIPHKFIDSTLSHSI